MPKKYDLRKLRVCIDRYPDDDEQLLSWARVAVEVNPVNAVAVCALPVFQDRLSLALLTQKKWQVGQEITYGFLRANAAIAGHVRQAVADVSKVANLKLREVNAASAMLRVADYEQGAWSYLGTDALGIPKGQQTINLARSWADQGTATHELLHAVGMVHEHQSPAAPQDLWNEEAVYRYYAGPPNHWDRETTKSNVIDRYSQNQTQFTDWDRKSIMLYPLAAELLKDKSLATGWNNTMSDTDKAFLSKVYPFADKPEPPTPDDKFTLPASGTYTLQKQVDGKTKLIFN